jgi:hypothetical protein
MSGTAMGPTGRPSILSHDQYEEIINKIHDSHLEKRQMTLSQICIEMLPNTFYHFAKRRVHFEDSRLKVTQEDLDRHFLYLGDTIERVPAHFVLNMDETGHQPWADAEAPTCFIPAG